MFDYGRCLADFFHCDDLNDGFWVWIFEYIAFCEIFRNYQCGYNRLFHLQLIVGLFCRYWIDDVEVKGPGSTVKKLCHITYVRVTLFPSKRLTVFISWSCVIFRWSIFWINPCRRFPSLKHQTWISEKKLNPAASEFIIVAPIARPDADGPAEISVKHARIDDPLVCTFQTSFWINQNSIKCIWF